MSQVHWANLQHYTFEQSTFAGIATILLRLLSSEFLEIQVVQLSISLLRGQSSPKVHFFQQLFFLS